MQKEQKIDGFTLIEMLIAMVVLTASAGGLLGLQYILSQNQILILSSYKNENDASQTVTSFSREIRSAKTSDSGSYPLEIANDSEIAFYSDIDFDGKTERVRYFLTGTQLSKAITKPTDYPVSYPAGQEKVSVVATDIRNGTAPVFYYYNSDWPVDTQNNPLSSQNRLANTRSVKMSLKVNKTANESDKDFLVESGVQIRMLKDNL